MKITGAKLTTLKFMIHAEIAANANYKHQNFNCR